MSSSGEKTEQPTPKKLRDARKKGQVAHSKDVSSTALIVGIFAVLFIGGAWTFENLQETVVVATENINEPFNEALLRVGKFTFHTAVIILLPILLVVLVFGVGVNMIQVGPLLAMESVKPNLNKLNPISKLKQIFSIKNAFEFIKSLLKIIFLGVLIFLVIRNAIPDLLQLPYADMDAVMRELGALLWQVAIITIIAFIVVAAADYFFQRWQFTKQLMMTKDEVKREYKEMEGDPTIKSKRKQLHQEMAMSETTERTRKASVLVTNPTHYSVAIYYKEGETKLPVLLAKGEGLLAKRMREIAAQEGIPIMENVPLARALYADGDMEQYIPSEFIEPVAEVLRWVRKLQEEPPA
ncbi:MAG: type III secretion system export apparatus subunit SctU [Pirellulales bacterium]|nr:type III secretion system export apparatus subunit SctU [Pirellulales bacterium]